MKLTSISLIALSAALSISTAHAQSNTSNGLFNDIQGQIEGANDSNDANIYNHTGAVARFTSLTNSYTAQKAAAELALTTADQSALAIKAQYASLLETRNGAASTVTGLTAKLGDLNNALTNTNDWLATNAAYRTSADPVERAQYASRVADRDLQTALKSAVTSQLDTATAAEEAANDAVTDFTAVQANADGIAYTSATLTNYTDALGLLDQAGEALATATSALNAATPGMARLARADAVLTPATTNANPAIAAAAGALLGDPAAATTNFETEVVAALVDHEARITRNSQAILDEKAARIAADNVLSTRINQLDRKMSSSTATAIAMGGAAFLPNMKFNLTTNVATYNGAYAISAQVGYLVRPNFALNAGIGGGLNYGGKVGGRVGATFGF